MEEKNYKSRGEMVGETLKQEILDLRRNRALWRLFLTGEPT